MTVFIPALIAVLLAELGGRATMFLRLPRLPLAAIVLGLAVGIAAVAGAGMAPAMTANARALLLGLALILTGSGQFGAAPAGGVPATTRATLLFVWRSGAPFLAFAFSIWKAAAIGAAAGALAGVVGAVALGALSWGPVVLVRIRRAAGSALIVTGFYLILWALRLVT